jgi:sodium bicarbonate transporter 10
VFHEVAYRARNREDLVAGLDEFLDSVTVLPPGEWDPTIRIEPPDSVPSQAARRMASSSAFNASNNNNNNKNNNPGLVKDEKSASDEVIVNEEEEAYNLRKEAGLVRSGRLFGGLTADLKRKAPWWSSDFRDAASLQSLASIIFLYFACLAPTIAFGGLLGQATGNNMASIESLVSALTSGLLYGLLAGQPLTVLGLTGPDLIFETLVYDFCEVQAWSYLSFRLWIGVWITVILLVLVATDASAYVCYITRFTEECFACLIAIIFIKKSVESLLGIASQLPYAPYDCYCTADNLSSASKIHESSYWLLNSNETAASFDYYNNTVPATAKCAFNSNDTEDNIIYGNLSPGCSYVPNAFFVSCLLFLGTFLISTTLKGAKATGYGPAWLRAYVADFAVILGMLAMVGLDMVLAVPTPKLMVPDSFTPTSTDRQGWLVPPFGPTNPWWSAVLAVIPALLGSILIFMDQQITAVITNRNAHMTFANIPNYFTLPIYFL